MTKKANFDPKEWHDLMYFACIGVSYKYSTRDVHSFGDLIGFIREMMSVQTFFSKAMEKYGKYELMQDVINEMTNACKSRQDLLSDAMQNYSDLGPVVARANQILADRATDDEARAMRAYTYELAFEIASAAGDGFLGTGEKISQAETEFLHELKRHLLDT
jgi:hypothetical protein